MIKAIFFDMDGTVLDSESLYLKAWTRLCENNSLNLPSDVFINLIGLNDKDCNDYLYNNVDKNFIWENLWGEFRDIAKEMKKHGIPLKKGYNELHEYLKKHNIKSYIVTSTKTDAAKRDLEQSKILQDFEDVIGFGATEKGKPFADPYLKALELSKLQKSECLVVEDSSNGIKSALAAEIDCVFCRDIKDIDEDLKSKIYCQVKSLDEIVEIIKNKEGI